MWGRLLLRFWAIGYRFNHVPDPDFLAREKRIWKYLALLTIGYMAYNLFM